MDSKHLPSLGSFHLICSFCQAGLAPDSEGIIGSAEETRPTLFQRLWAATPRLHPCNIIMIRPGESQQSHELVLCSCNVGVRQPGIQRGRSEAAQQLTDFLWPGQTKFTTLQTLIVLFFARLLSCRCFYSLWLDSRTKPNVN